jgi:hypothetical protein
MAEADKRRAARRFRTVPRSAIMPTHLHSPLRQVPLGFTPELYPEGTHICYLYNDDEERKRFMSMYVSSGIDEREFVTYLADTPSDLVEQAIERLGISLPSPERRARLNARPALATCCPGGQFVPDTMLATLRDFYTNKPADSAGARLAAEMTWALHDIPGCERLVEFEGRVTDLVGAYPLTALCQYDTRKFDGATIFRLLNVHPIMIVDGQIMRNPFYVPRAESSGTTDGTRNGQSGAADTA